MPLKSITKIWDWDWDCDSGMKQGIVQEKEAGRKKGREGEGGRERESNMPWLDLVFLFVLQVSNVVVLLSLHRFYESGCTR